MNKMKASSLMTLLILWSGDVAVSENIFSFFPNAKDSSNPPDGVGEKCWGHMVALQEKIDRFFISPNTSDRWALESK